MKVSLVALIGLIFIPMVVSASSVVRTGESVIVAADQVVEGDFYGLGSTLAISGTVSEDLLLTGGAVTVNGTAGEDIFTIGGTVDMHGSAGDDVRVVGGVVTVAGDIEGDLLVFASELKLLSTATVRGDVLFFGGSGEIAGSVGKNILGTTDSLRVDGVIGGDIDVTARLLTLGERTTVAGNLTYVSMQEVIRAQGATVQGTVVRNEDIRVGDDGVRSLAISFLVLLFASLVIFLLLRTFTERVSLYATEHYFRSFIIGFGVVFLVPTAAVILFFSTLGSIIGIILIGLYTASIALAIPLACSVAGLWVMRLLRQNDSLSVVTVVLGTIAIMFVFSLPVIGQFIAMIAVFTTLGALAEQWYRLLRS